MFPDSDLSGMLDDLLEKGVIELPEPTPDDVGRTANPKYCRYHRMVSHPLEKCITLKECIMRVIEDGPIILDLDDVVETMTFPAKQVDCLSFNFEVWNPLFSMSIGCHALPRKKDFSHLASSINSQLT